MRRKSADVSINFKNWGASEMSSKSAKGSGNTDKPTKKEQSLFEEDDEFEEFPTEGISSQRFTICQLTLLLCV